MAPMSRKPVSTVVWEATAMRFAYRALRCAGFEALSLSLSPLSEPKLPKWSEEGPKGKRLGQIVGFDVEEQERESTKYHNSAYAIQAAPLKNRILVLIEYDVHFSCQRITPSNPQWSG